MTPWGDISRNKNKNIKVKQLWHRQQLQKKPEMTPGIPEVPEFPDPFTTPIMTLRMLHLPEHMNSPQVEFMVLNI